MLLEAAAVATQVLSMQLLASCRSSDPIYSNTYCSVYNSAVVPSCVCFGCWKNRQGTPPHRVLAPEALVINLVGRCRVLYLHYTYINAAAWVRARHGKDTTAGSASN
jgi:hypothetical protein